MSDALSMPRNVAEPPISGKRRWRLLIGVGAILAFTTCLVLLYWVAIRGRASRHISEEMNRIRAAGEPTTFEEVIQSIPPPKPEKDCTSLYRSVFSEVTSDEFYRSSSALAYIGDDEGEIPLPGEDWPDFAAAAEFIDNHKGTIHLLDKAVAMGGQCRFPLTTDDLSEGNLHREVFRSRDAVALLQLRADVAAHRRDAQEVCDALLAMRAASECLAAEPDSLALASRWSINSTINRHTARMIGVVAFTDAQLEELQFALRRVDYAPQLHASLMCDRVNLMEMLRSPQHWWWSSLDPADVDAYLSSSRRICDAAKSVDVFAAAENIDGVAREVQAELDSRKRTSKSFQLTNLDVSGAKLSAHFVVQITTFNRALDALLACERYRLAHGAYPRSVDQLEPEFLPTAPEVTRFNGRLRFLPEADGIVVYFVGQDGQDAGGELMSRESNVDDIGYRSNS